ncbi:hypothetical protein EDD99_3429 [Streptomyces sp. 846.5]|nr:hypothetical protein EDD99_3429 [Streptomyces sp. 846.5]
MEVMVGHRERTRTSETGSGRGLTNGDGTPLGSNQRWTARDSLDGNGILVWIGSYLNSPPPPPSITLTVSCIC